MFRLISHRSVSTQVAIKMQNRINMKDKTTLQEKLKATEVTNKY